MRSSIAIVFAAALALTGCAAQTAEQDLDTPDNREEPASSDEQESSQQEFPRTIEIPGGEGVEPQTVTLEQAPERVAALTYETGELVAQLGEVDRLVLVQESLTKDILSSFPQEMGEVEFHAPTEGSIDAEAVIAADPDLVLLTARRGLEEDLGQVVQEAGIPLIVLPNQWSTVEETTENIQILAQALGVDQAGEELVEELEDGLSPREVEGDAPRVLVLSNQAGQPFVTAGRAFPLEMVRLAGGEDAGEELDLVRTGPITAEQVVAIDPDGIVLLDMNGSGEAVFEELLTNDAVGELEAVKQDRIVLMEGRDMQALGFRATIDGLEQLHTWLVEEVSAT